MNILVCVKRVPATAGKITLRDGAAVEVLNPPAAGAVDPDVAQVAQNGNGTSN